MKQQFYIIFFLFFMSMVPMKARENAQVMFNYINDFPEQFRKAQEIGNNIVIRNKVDDIEAIVFAGMGGSGIAGQVVATTLAQELKIPIVTVKNYELPNWVNEKTLVILMSYSGNTEETLTCFQDAKERNACIAGITSGGRLQILLEQDGCDVIRIPGGMQPRAALGYLSIPLYWYLFKVGFLCNAFIRTLDQVEIALEKARNLYHSISDSNLAYQIAQKIQNKQPIIYGSSDTTEVVATRWRAQLAENCKIISSSHVLPEMNHNELEAFVPSLCSKNVVVVWLADDAVHDRIKKRYKVCSDLIDPYIANQISIELPGASFTERLFNTIYLGDWVSYWLAALNDTDPLIIPNICALKEKMQ